MEDSQNCRTWEEDTYWKNFHSMHFYQIVPTDVLHGFTLPKKFTDNMMNKLPKKVTLKGPSEVNWDVNLVKGEDDATLKGDGWKEFVKAYSLKKGDTLMFKYNQSECFEVLIFDRSNLCEKEFSYFVRKCQKPQFNDGNADKSSKNPVEKLTDRCQDGDDSFLADQCDKCETSGKMTTENVRKRKYTPAEEPVPEVERPRGTCYKSNRRPVTEAEKTEALRMAEDKLLKSQISFLVILKPSDVYKHFFMSIHDDWYSRYIFKNGEDVILQVGEKTWVCKFCSVIGGFDGGWKRFVSENSLEEFDVCVFVPGNRNGMTYVLQVSIFRVVQRVIPPTVISSS